MKILLFMLISVGSSFSVFAQGQLFFFQVKDSVFLNRVHPYQIKNAPAIGPYISAYSYDTSVVLNIDSLNKHIWMGKISDENKYMIRPKSRSN